jgi:hypothetical protein
MDLKIYYQKIRETQGKIADEFPVVVSQETQDGGKAGVAMEVSRPLAAKMFVEGTARPATVEEAKAFREKQAKGKEEADAAAASAKLNVTVVPTATLEKLTAVAQKPAKSQG